ncbi:FecR domain-containing protein [Aliifodinibius sp. S!AR15-10]|nr:FecR domain-containing protein [Aliifodinibius sp. S!AR15-10]
MKNDSFRKWVHGEANDEEKEYWDNWVKASSQNRTLAQKAQRRIAGLSIESSEKIDVEKGWKDIETSLEEKPTLHKVEATPGPRNQGLAWIWRVAAALLIAGITGLSVYYYQEKEPVKQEQVVQHEVKTQYGERKTISLTDGSQITLNAHSTLIYKTSNVDNFDIEVYLEGEAYFSVSDRKENNASPFRVRTAAGQIQVLGTEFVVSARNSRTRVILKEGSVAVDPLKPQQQVLLKPGEMAEFDSSWDAVRTKLVNPEVYTSWRTRVLVFDKTPLAEVVDRLEYTFGVNVIVREPDLFKQKITGSIENEGLEVITSALARTLDTSVEITQDTVYLGE